MENDYTFKVLVLGDPDVGKSSFVRRYVDDRFSSSRAQTKDVDFALKHLHWDSNTIIRIQLWDLAGQERFCNITHIYYRGAVGAFFLYDVTRPSTLEAVKKWKNDLDRKSDGTFIPTVLLGNKCDQVCGKRKMDGGKMDDLCREKGFDAWFDVSAKNNVNIDKATRHLIGLIMANDALYSPNNFHDSIQLSMEVSSMNRPEETKKGCCW